MIMMTRQVRTMSNSKLATYIRYSPNRTAPRQGKIKNIVIHHMAGCLTVQQCGAVFASRSRAASSNYGVDSSGRIGLYVSEKNRAWTTGNRIDHSSVTIEVANSKRGGNWPVSDKALQATIRLCADICKRNGIEKLNYTGDKKGNLLMHRWYQQTACPGPYLAGKFKYIATEVNKLLGVAGPAQKLLQVGSKIKIKKGACLYGSSANFKDFVYERTYKVKSITGSRVAFMTTDGKTTIGAVSRNDCIVQ